MNSSKLTIIKSHDGFSITPPNMEALKVWAIGKPIDEVIETLPLIFNLCKSAQRLGLHLAFGKEANAELMKAIYDEIIKDHHFKLQYHFPKVLDLEIGHYGFSEMLDAYAMRLETLAPELLDLRFSSDAMNGLLPSRTYPECKEFCILDMIDARITEYLSLNEGAKLEIKASDGRAVVPASRGAYEIRASAKNGRISTFTRITPTDLMLKKNGIFEQLLQNLKGASLKSLKIAIALIDPCYDIVFEAGGANA